MLDFIWFLIIGVVAGWLAGRILKGSGFGLFGDLIVGVIGSFVGGILFQALGLHTSGGSFGHLVTSTGGAIAFLWLFRLVKK